MNNMSEKKYSEVYNEGGEGYNHVSVNNEIEGMKEFEEMVKREHAEWTLEVTKERRELFNNAKPTRQTLAKIQQELGFTMFDLQNAVKRHGI